MPGLVPPSYHVEAQYVPDDDVLAICCPACGANLSVLGWSTTPRLKPGACPRPASRAGLRGRLTAAHRPVGRYSGGECYGRR